MANKIKVLFWLRRSKINHDGQVPLMLRLSFKNQRAEKATGYYISPGQWNLVKQRLKGSTDYTKQINEWLDASVVKIADLFNDEVDKNATVHLPSLIKKLFADSAEEPTLLQIMKEYNEKLSLRVYKDFAPYGTLHNNSFDEFWT